VTASAALAPAPSTQFAFDLDGTVTQREILPLIAGALDLYNEMVLLTRLTLDGTLRFEESFRLRVQILRSVPVSRVQRIVEEVPLDPAIEAFIRANRERCAIVTGNLDCWIAPLVERLGCASYSSIATTDGDQLTGIRTIQNKSHAIQAMRAGAGRVVAIGESTNDLPMFEEADMGVAFGGVHEPVPALVQISDYVTYESSALCDLLATLS
jgi:phosphoserine phosphatase